MNRRNLYLRFVQNSMVYGLGIILVKMGGILVLPLYFIKLSPEDFGIISISQIINLVFIPLLGFGSADAVLRFYHEWDKDERGRHIAALWFFSAIISTTVCLLLDFGGSSLWSQIIHSVPFSPYIQLTIWTALASSFINFCLNLFKAEEKLKLYNLVSIGVFVSQIGLILFFLFKLEMGVYGFLLASLLSYAFWAILCIFYSFSQFQFPFKKQHLIEPLQYSLPIIPSSFLESIAFASDRFLLEKFLSLSQVGLYNVANQFGTGLNFFNQFLKAAYVPFVYRVDSERADAKEVLGNISVLYMFFMILPAMLISVFAKDFIMILNKPDYFKVADFIPLSILYYFLFSFGIAFGRGMELAKKNVYTIFLLLLWFVTTVVFIIYLTPRYGLLGSFAAVILSLAIRIVVQVYLSLKLFYIPIPWIKLWSMLAIALFSYLIGSLVGNFGTLVGVLERLAILSLGFFFIFKQVAGSKLSKELLSQFLKRLKIG